jgi:N-6 DNA Methylase
MEIAKIVKKISFLHSTSIETPTSYELAKILVSKISVDWKNPNLRILDPCCGRGIFLLVIVEILLQHGHSKADIAKMIYGCDVSKVQSAIARKVLFLALGVEPNIYCEDSLTRTWNMKFDVVVGNPPFQDSSKTEKGGSTLWSSFIKKAVYLTADGGYLAFVTPNAWMSFNQSGKPLKGKQLTTVWTNVAKFFKVGSTFSAWILHNVPTYTVTEFPDDNITLDLRKHESLPVGRPVAAVSIVEKVYNFPGDKFEPKIEKKIKVGYSERKNSYTGPAQETSDDVFKYEVFHTNSKTYFTSVEPTDYNVPKVIVSTSSPMPRYYENSMGCATGDLRSYFTVANETEGNNLIALLNSKLYKMAWRRPGMITWRALFLPKLDLSKEWTDQELYTHFNLTQDEIDIVEKSSA